MSFLASEMDKENTTMEEIAAEQRKMAVSPVKTVEEAVKTLPNESEMEIEAETAEKEPENEEKEEQTEVIQEEQEEQNDAVAAEPVETKKKAQKWRYLEEGEELVGALEMSPMVDGKRRRSMVNRLVAPSPVIKAGYTGGSGAPLSEEPHFMEMVAKLSSEELKPIHRVLYGNPGKKASIKRELRKFNGFSFKEESSEYEKRQKIIIGLKSKEFALLQTTFKKYYWPKENRKDKENYAKELLKILAEPPSMEKKTGKKRPATAEQPKAKRTRPAKKAVESDEEEEEEVEDPIIEKEKPEKVERKQRTARTKTTKYVEDDEEENEEEEEEIEKEVKKPKAKKRQYKQLTESEDSDESEDEKDENIEAEGDKDDENGENREEETGSQDLKNPNPTEEDLTRVCTEILKNVDFNTVTKAQIYEMICKKFPKMKADERKDEIKAVVRDTVKKVYIDA